MDGRNAGRDWRTRVSLVAFTQAGCALARRIVEGLEQEVTRAQVGGQRGHAVYEVAELVTTERLSEATGLASYGQDLMGWVGERFARGHAFVFVGATGIAVRAIAPYIRDKMSDPAVVSVDEKGRFAVPLLSGHVGGANDLARAVATITGGQAAISTATDVNGQFAVDEWAHDQGLAIVERNLAKEVSACLLAGEMVGFASDWPVAGSLPGGLAADDADLPIGISVTFDTARHPFARTLHLVPRATCVGVGCRRGVDLALLRERVRSVLASAGIDSRAVVALATIDVKRDEPAIRLLAEDLGWELRTFSAEELAAVPGDFAGSDFVRQTVGVDNVCERAAVAASGGGRLVVRKQAADGVTVAVAADEPQLAWPAVQGGLLSVVGLGPGAGDDLTLRAHRVLAESDLIVGYGVYVDLVHDLYPDKPTLTTPMRGEVRRCQMALDEAARGRRVALVCSGDPGVYGMAGLCLELEDRGRAAGGPPVAVEVIPGVTAANGGAAVLGAPLMHDFAVISLSDLMTPWDTIAARLEAAAASDMVVALYNPSSKKRTDYLRKACDILLRHKAPGTVCGLVRNIGREGQSWQVTTLAELRETRADMFTTVYVGNAATRSIGGRMVTPRGYDLGEGDSHA